MSFYSDEIKHTLKTGKNPIYKEVCRKNVIRGLTKSKICSIIIFISNRFTIGPQLAI